MQVSASANDAGSGLATIEVSVDGGSWNTYSAPLAFDDGPHTYQFRATDQAGNLSKTALQQIQVDTVPPAIDLPKSWKLGQTTIFKLEDDGSGLSSVRLVIEDDDERYPKVTWDESLGSYKFKGEIDWDGRFKDGQLAPPGDGYYAWLKVSDHAGNESMLAGQISFLWGTLWRVCYYHPRTGLPGWFLEPKHPILLRSRLLPRLLLPMNTCFTVPDS